MIGEKLGFVLAHSGHPQGSKRRSLSIRRKGNTTRAWRLEWKRLRRKERCQNPCPPNNKYPGEGAGQRRTRKLGKPSPKRTRTRSVAEELLMHAIRLEPVKVTSRENWSGTRKTYIGGADVRGPSQ
jgi:hypothetical protein